MAVKYFEQKLEDIPEEVREHYKGDDEKGWTLDIPDAVPLTEKTKLTGALTKERGDHRGLKNRWAALKGEDGTPLTPEQVQEELESIPALREAAAANGADPAKLKPLIDAEVKKVTGPLQRALTEKETALQTATQSLNELLGKETTRTMHDTVRAAATKAGVRPEAIEDALVLAERVLEKDEAGDFVVKQGSGYTEGVTAETWLTQVRDKRPHWWNDTSGGGGARGSGGNVGGKNPWSAADWNMTEQGKMLRENPKKAAQMAGLAGTTIGGPRPAAKK